MWAAEEPLQRAWAPAPRLPGAAYPENTSTLLSCPSSKKLPDAPTPAPTPDLLLWQL